MKLSADLDLTEPEIANLRRIMHRVIEEHNILPISEWFHINVTWNNGWAKYNGTTAIFTFLGQLVQASGDNGGYLRLEPLVMEHCIIGRCAMYSGSERALTRRWSPSCCV